MMVIKFLIVYFHNSFSTCNQFGRGVGGGGARNIMTRQKKVQYINSGKYFGTVIDINGPV